ncbi:Rieske (2Fe-2S) protein [Bacillus horti]|uniref:Nitrite reductase/ring-hydroxylating ferredoxin subunit n=1 Tax=Caldalkalibacillus horti TaxID=77523 RepID=A0ABT9VTG0_9BACI|nr:Rieske 2Fe-2S domain-containing protein [Bacillus horti]MDQ0164164.1 nitrite reductase/ring-hydroxylating ferredoxin subunit [Bacillus horti]
MENFIYAGSVEKLKENKVKVVKGGQHGVAVLFHEGDVYAIDNRCPHLGFPLHQGSLCDGILTCHWHHARFDVKSGGTLDSWADDMTTYPVEIKQGEIWVSPIPHHKQTISKLRERLKNGLEQNLSLVIAKGVVGLIEAGESAKNITRIGVEFGTKHRQRGWRSGLTILTAMTNILPKLDKNGQILALYQGLVHVARESANMGTRFLLGPLPLNETSSKPSLEKFAQWYRHSVEVRDTQGAERVILTAIESGATNEQLADMMMTAVTDHFYMNVGHTLDFHNKAFEVLEHIGAEHRAYVLTSIIPELSNASRSEEQHSWQSPVNLVEQLHTTFKELTPTLESKSTTVAQVDEQALVNHILGDQPGETLKALLTALKEGMSPVKLAQIVTLAAGERLARFHVQNELGDWITVLHTFTHAHAVHESLKRSTTPELIRAVFHTAMSIYLDRFLNTPAARRPKPDSTVSSVPQAEELLQMLDRQQQTDQAGKWVITYLAQGGDKQDLFNTLGHALVREDAEFHTFQMYEAAVTEHDHWQKEEESFAEYAQETMILALTRYLAAHSPTSREIPHTARIAMRLHRGEKLFEDEN